MGFRFRRTIRLGKGLRINISKSGTSLSLGHRGATVNFGPKGEKLTLGLPGSGLSYSQMIKPQPGQPPHQAAPTVIPAHDPNTFPQRASSPLARRVVWGVLLCLLALLSLGAFIAT